MFNLWDKKVFIMATEEHKQLLCQRRYLRDYNFPNINKDHFQDYWEKVMWPYYLKYGMRFPEGTLVLNTENSTQSHVDRIITHFNLE